MHLGICRPHWRMSLHTLAVAETRNTPRHAPAIVSDTLTQPSLHT